MSDCMRKYEDIRKKVEKSSSDREEIMNSRKKVVVPRKYHLTPQQVIKFKGKWDKAVEGMNSLKDLAGIKFFNPYRENGGYYGSVQALFLLGSNLWHSYSQVRDKMNEDMSTRASGKREQSSWDKFAGRIARDGATSTKDLMGRIIQNFKTLQRLGGLHPYGLKLKELCSTIDIRRDKSGIYYFRLNTLWNSKESVKPMYDINEYESNRDSGTNVTTLTKEEVSSVEKVVN